MHVVQALAALNVGGSELVATELAEYLVSNGHHVTVIAADGPIGARVRASGAQHLDWPIGKKRFSSLPYITRMARWFAAEQPDVVHVHSRFPAWLCWKALQRIPARQRPAFLTTMHGHYSVSWYSSVMARGARTIAVSEHIRDYTLRNYPAARHGDIVTIHGGINRSDFSYGYQPTPGWRAGVDAQFPALANKRWLMLPGRVTRWKGHVDFMHVVAALKDDYPGLHGVIVGGCRTGSRYQAELEALAARTGIGGRITFTGDRLDIRDWISSAEIVFNLSNDPPEAFGRTVLEALALGRPLIAWNHGGAAEILQQMFPDGAVRPLDYRALHALTRQFLQHPPTVNPSEAFSLEASMQKHLSVYQAVAEERRT